jgi:hypothetical protein
VTNKPAPIKTGTLNVVSFSAAALANDHEFLVAMARFGEGGLTEKQVRKKYSFPDEVWAKLGEDDALYEAIEAEKTRRVRDGSCKRERAQALVVEAPQVLSDIMLGDNNSPRHRVDAAKALDAIASPVAQAAASDANRFIIRIDLSAGASGREVVEVFNRPLAIGPNDDISKSEGADDAGQSF